ncbi:MAG: penicillin-binding transpeptidase domain-containing protein, partial [Candidatus Cloacimonadales bacterium]
TGASASRIKQRLTSKKKSVMIDNDISERNILQLKAAFFQRKIPGLVVSFSKIERTYPKGKLASRLLGMVGKIEPDGVSGADQSLYTLEGKCGLESSYNDQLTGSFGWVETISDAKNKHIPILQLQEKLAQNGDNLILTMNMDIQEILEEKLRHGLQEYQAANAMGLIMDPYSGNIVAMAGISAKDDTRSAAYLRSQSNMVASFMFEPGSVMKPITALLALENKLFQPDEIISTKDYKIEYGDKFRYIRDDHDYGNLNLKDIIAHSSNVGISKAVEQIGNKALYERMLALGFGQSTSSNLSNEAPGIFRKLSDWQGYSLHSISFGHEVSVTVLQLAVAYSAFANGGKVMRPNIVRQIEDSKGNIIHTAKPQVLRTISDQKSLDTLKDYLKSVFDYGTARHSKLSYLEMAGKTGTAEKQIMGTSGYSDEKYTSVFTGFFPVDKPKYVAVVVYDEADFKSYSYYASNSAAPTFSAIAQQIVKLPDSNILTDITIQNTTYTEAPDLIGKTYAEVQEILQQQNLKAKIMDQEKGDLVLNQFPKPHVSYDIQEKMIIIFGTKQAETNSTLNLDYQMPDIVGYTLRQALNKTNQRGIKLIVQGNGVIRSQSIPAGTQIKYGEQCEVVAR